MSMTTTTDGGDSMRRSAARNPRRRVRDATSNSPSQPRRKRSRYHEVEPAAAVDTTESIRSGLNALAVQSSASFSRTADAARHKRPPKTDNAHLLAQTEHYSVRHLPSTPDILRNSASGTWSTDSPLPLTTPSDKSRSDYRASILSSPSLALAVTRERAYIWDYTSPAPVTHPKTFDVPRPARSVDPLPLAALVTSPTREVGLLVVSAVTGHVTYWQNIDTAESLTLFNQQNTAVNGSIGSLSSGETVIHLASADHAGFIITLSSGRIAQISLIDDQGKPSISAQFLRSTDAASSAGLFGSLKNAFGVGLWKRDIVSVRTRPLPARREIQAIAATETGHIYTWHLAWSGQPTFRGSFDFRQFLQNELAALLGENNISLLDMVITPSSSAADAPLQMILLVQAGPASSPSYAMAKVTMTGQDDAQLEAIISINSGPSSPATSRPRLLLPKPGHTAFILFEREVIVASVEDRRPFQDAIRLRSDKHVTIEGGCEEDVVDTKGTCSCTIFVKGHGLVRTSAAQTNDSYASTKSKIEQAIFYGTISDNILDFSRRPQDRYDPEETENAALLVSDEILRSTSPFIPPLTSSLEAHLQNRIRAIRALILHVRSDYPPVSKSTSWKLLTDAEKLAAAQAVWTKYEETSSKSVLLSSVVHAYYKYLGDQASVDLDADLMRPWFVNEVGNIAKLRNMILFTIVVRHEEGNDKNLMQLVSEANDILFSMYDTVFQFRTDNVEIYGLDSTLYNDGVLEQGYEDLTEPWTSPFDFFNAMNKFIDVSREHAVAAFDDNSKDADVLTVEKVVNENVHLVRILCLCYRERIGYVKAHHNENGPSYASGLQEAFVKSRSHHLRSLNKIGQSAAGIGIAEKYKDMHTLVKLVINESEYMSAILSDAAIVNHEKKETQIKMDKLQAKVEGYFRSFGDDWANAFFDSHLTNYHSYGLLRDAEQFKEYLTRYLRAEKSRGRLSWINEVLQEGDYQEASKALTNLAQEQEIKFWNKKIELSLAKLTSLAAVEETGGKASGLRLDDDLTRTYIQEALRQHLEYILYAAVDTEAEVELACDTYFVYLKREVPALYGWVRASLEKMLKNEALTVEQIIDILTLMDTKDSEDPEANIIGKQFLMALQTLEAARSRMDETRFETNLRLIWKRCYLQDDWEYINNTKKRSDKLISRHIRETFACQTMVRGLQLSLFHPGSGIRMMAPSETLGAGCTTKELESTFPQEELREPIVHDNMTQDKKIGVLIEKANADHWHAVCVEEAKKTLEEETATNVQEEAAAEQLQQSLEEAENGLVDAEQVDAQMADDMETEEHDGDVQMA